MSPAIYFSCNTWHNGRSISSNYHQCFSLRSVTARHLHSSALLCSLLKQVPDHISGRKERWEESSLLSSIKVWIHKDFCRLICHVLNDIMFPGSFCQTINFGKRRRWPRGMNLMNKRARPKRVFLPKGLKTLASLSLCFSSLSRTLDLPLPQQSSSNSTTTMVTICLSPSPATKMEKKC